jgi:WXG100 family type VII secretion target
MAEIGMDPDAVRAVATKLDAQAQTLHGSIASIDHAVLHLQDAWVGPDAQAFHSWWMNQHKPALQRAHDSIAGLAQSARNNASEQDQASGGDAQPGTHWAQTPPPVLVPHASSLNPPTGDGTAPGGGAGISGTQNYDPQNSIDRARSEMNTKRPIGWDQPGECIKSVQRWIDDAGGHFGGGGVISGYTNSGAVAVPMGEIRPGDVLQLTSPDGSDSNWSFAHTVLVAGKNPDGSYDIIQSNATFVEGKTYAEGTVTEDHHWTPDTDLAWRQRHGAGDWQWRAWRFAKD